MQNSILLIGQTNPTTLRVQKILRSRGYRATLVTPAFAAPSGFEYFSDLLSTHRFVATIVERPPNLGLMANNFLIQRGIDAASHFQLNTPDMWVQFGVIHEVMRESELDAESIAQRLLEEFFEDDHRPISKRTKKPVV